MVSLVIPVYNEKANIRELLARLHAALNPLYKNYEIVIIDDHSTDGSWELLANLKSKYPIKTYKKEGKKGKAFSLIEGFNKTYGDTLVMIDADQQYPPEAIPQMIEALKEQDVIVANRSQYLHSKTRKILSRVFKFAFGKLLFGQDADIQSGLKVFKRRVWQTVKFRPRSQWSFDLEFLHRAKQAGFEIGNHDITFDYRKNGHSKIEVAKTGLELAKHAILLKFKKIHPQHLAPTQENSMIGAGVGYHKKQFITHTTLSLKKSALITLTNWQRLFIISMLILIAAAAYYFGPKQTAIGAVAVLTSIYFADVIFNAFLITRSLKSSPEISFTDDELNSIDDSRLPLYTILCPLYKEARVLRQFAQGIEDLNWPKGKLEVILLLEEDDKETQDAAKILNLPSYFKTVIVPPSSPKTKPKACNWGLNHARGKYIVIYDAEDKPEPLQLKKAYLAFEKFGDKITCFQANLNYYNTHHNLLTKFFTAEYSLWFGLILTGLQSLDTTIPLGGTSNHFKTETLKKLEGWDPFNVTEDCDLGVRLFKDGYQTAIIDSATLEEANSKIGNWLRQRSRWIKGYMQTFLVHNRDFGKFVKNHKHHSAIFQLVVGGKIAFIMINPFMWLTTISYFVFRASLGPTIEQFFPGVIFYMAAFCLVAGNFLYLYYYMIAVVKHEKFNLVKYVLFIPIYWAMISTAFWIAAYQLIFKPHYWEKTIHGFHLAKEKKALKEADRPRFIPFPVPSFIKSNLATSGGVLVIASVIANFFNFLYNAYLGRRISAEEFGLVSLVGSFLYLSSIPIGALGKTVSHRSAFLLGKYETSAKQFWSHIRKRAILISLAVTALWLAASPALATFFHAESLEPFIIFAPVWFIGLASTVDSGFLTGSLKFKVLALLIVCESSLKFLFSLFLVELGYDRFVYAAIPASMAIAFLIGWIFAMSIKETQTKAVDRNVLLKFPRSFYLTSILTKVSTVAYLSFDIILAKHFLPPKEAGEYALLSLIGKMIFFVGSLFSQFINPVVSREEGAQRSSRIVFYKLLFLTATSAFGAYLAVGVFSFYTAPILFGEKVQPIIHLLPIYGFGIFCFSVAASFVTFYQVRQKHLLALVSFLIALSQIIGIVFYHQELNQIVNVMNTIGIVSLAVMISLHFTYRPFTAIARNISDLLALFSLQIEKSPTLSGRLRILIFNWRDTKHVWSGGAETYIHEIAKHFVKEGHLVTIFCGNDGKSARSEAIDGVSIVRRGGFYTVYFWAALYYIFKFRGNFDVIIDSENGIPFFTPLYARVPIIGLVHHVHQEVFRRHLSFPLAQIAQFLEGKLMPLVYRNIKMITISKSSKEAMQALGFKSQIEIVNPGVDLNRFRSSAKSESPSILYLGRLKPYKSIDRLISAFSQVAKDIPNATLTIAGEGESRQFLEGLTQKLNLNKFVRFVGRVSEQAKADLLAKSWLMVQPSTVEGWGITVIEANAAGTTVVASDVPGLRDSVRNPHTGLLVTWDNQEKWTDAMVKVIKDENFRKSLETEALLWSKNFSWDKSSEKFTSVIKRELKKGSN